MICRSFLIFIILTSPLPHYERGHIIDRSSHQKGAAAVPWLGNYSARTHRTGAGRTGGRGGGDIVAVNGVGTMPQVAVVGLLDHGWRGIKKGSAIVGRARNSAELTWWSIRNSGQLIHSLADARRHEGCSESKVTRSKQGCRASPPFTEVCISGEAGKSVSRFPF